MAEEKSRFKIKKGDIEIEFESDKEEVNSRYEEAFQWVKTVAATTSPTLPTEPSEQKKEDKRGGARSSVISPVIDKLIAEGHLDEFTKIPDIVEELKRRNVPGASDNAVQAALNRRVPEKLDRVKDTDGKWTYRRKKK